jgi:TonB family protein
MRGRLASSVPFGVSAFMHGLLLSFLVMARVPPPAPAGSVNDQEIRPRAQHLVWYHFREKIPDVSPGKPQKDKRPLRARVKFQQNLVAGEKDLAGPPQLIRMPGPQIDLPTMLPLPNVLAVAPSRPLRPFQAPPALKTKPPDPAPELPDAPRLAAALPLKPLPFDAALPRPRARAFTPPPTAKAPAPVPPPELPAAPELSAAALSLAPPSIPHSFATPPAKPESPLPDAPPPVPGMATAVPAEATLAIVGLNPVKGPELPAPPGAHDAAFSAGPEVRTAGASEPPTASAAVTVPGLVARGGANDPPASLMSALAPLSRERMAADLAAASHTAAPAPPPKPAGPRAAHVSSAPNARLSGRYVYTVAIQMPNVTSYSGSWIVWFADRDPATRAIPADMRPPEPIRKVDPKYIQTAAEEGVQGIVRLAAVIRQDGHVERVELLQHLDERLDRSAEEALAKWLFTPAQRDGVAVDVDAVFEIPFRLAPKPSR